MACDGRAGVVRTGVRAPASSTAVSSVLMETQWDGWDCPPSSGDISAQTENANYISAQFYQAPKK